MRTLAFALVAATLAAAAGTAAAETEVSGRFDVIPSPTFHVEFNGDSESTDLDTTFGLAAEVAFAVSPNLSIGVAPRFVFGLKPEGEDESLREIDLAVRATAHAPVGETVHVYGYVAPGYSKLLVPESEIDDPTGLILGFAAGIKHLSNGRQFVGLEIGYQLGFQSIELPNGDAEISIDMLHVGISMGTLL